MDFNSRLKDLAGKVTAQRNRIVALTAKEKVIAEAKAAAAAKVAAVEAEVKLVMLKAKEAAEAAAKEAAEAAAKEAAKAAAPAAAAAVVAAVTDVVRVPAVG